MQARRWARQKYSDFTPALPSEEVLAEVNSLAYDKVTAAAGSRLGQDAAEGCALDAIKAEVKAGLRRARCGRRGLAATIVARRLRCGDEEGNPPPHS